MGEIVAFDVALVNFRLGSQPNLYTDWMACVALLSLRNSVYAGTQKAFRIGEQAIALEVAFVKEYIREARWKDGVARASNMRRVMEGGWDCQTLQDEWAFYMIQEYIESAVAHLEWLTV